MIQANPVWFILHQFLRPFPFCLIVLVNLISVAFFPLLGLEAKLPVPRIVLFTSVLSDSLDCLFWLPSVLHSLLPPASLNLWQFIPSLPLLVCSGVWVKLTDRLVGLVLGLWVVRGLKWSLISFRRRTGGLRRPAASNSNELTLVGVIVVIYPLLLRGGGESQLSCSLTKCFVVWKSKVTFY